MFHDEVFGELKRSAFGRGRWIGHVEWPSGSRVIVEVYPDDTSATDFRGARQAFAWLQANDEDIRRRVAADLLTGHYDSSRDEGPRLSEDDVIRGLKLVHVLIVDGALGLTYDASAVFGAYTVEAGFAADGSFMGTELY